MTTSNKRRLLDQALAKRVAALRSKGISVKETAELAGIDRSRVRTLEVLGQRLIEAGI